MGNGVPNINTGRNNRERMGKKDDYDFRRTGSRGVFLFLFLKKYYMREGVVTFI